MASPAAARLDRSAAAGGDVELLLRPDAPPGTPTAVAAACVAAGQPAARVRVGVASVLLERCAVPPPALTVIADVAAVTASEWGAAARTATPTAAALAPLRLLRPAGHGAAAQLAGTTRRRGSRKTSDCPARPLPLVLPSPLSLPLRAAPSCASAETA
jgi:hypothetical protein